MGTLRKNEKEVLEMRHNVIEMKSAFDWFINRLDRTEEGINEAEDWLIETV